jgi:acyl dehydratase
VTDLDERLQSYVGTSTGEHQAVDPVNLPMIRRYVDAMHDENPVYVDDDAARASGRDGVVAPPAMLPVWTMGGYRATLAALREPDAGRGVFGALAEAGFTLTPGTNISQRYARELRPGDRLRARGEVAAVSGEKETALGRARFVDLRSTYRDGDDQLVGDQVLRVIAFDPTSARRPHRATAGDDEPGDGEPLPSRELTLDRLGVIACTTACNDFRAGHYDPDLAQRIGMRDIFTDIPTSAGLTAAYVTGWAGPRARLLELDVALGVPLCAGDTVRFAGRPTAGVGADAGRMSVDVVGTTAFGRHVTARAVVERGQLSSARSSASAPP